MCKEFHFKMEGWKNAEEISVNAHVITDSMIRESEKGRQQLNCPYRLPQILHPFQNMSDVTFIETGGSF